jgi:hypothetical protein
LRKITVKKYFNVPPVLNLKVTFLATKYDLQRRPEVDHDKLSAGYEQVGDKKDRVVFSCAVKLQKRLPRWRACNCLLFCNPGKKIEAPFIAYSFDTEQSSRYFKPHFKT